MVSAGAYLRLSQFPWKGEGSRTQSVSQGHKKHTEANLSSRMFVTLSPTVSSFIESQAPACYAAMVQMPI